MTLAPRRDAVPVGTVEDVAGFIRAGGGRLSASRRLVLDALFAADGLISAEAIADWQDRSLDVSSVYRNLQHLEELGVVHHVHLGHGPGLYGLETATRREYVVCESCDRVDTVAAADLERVRAEVRAATGYEASFTHFPIVGLCPACAGQPTRPRPHRH